MSDLQFDYVIIGAGSAGCVLANRLSEGGLHRVALIEAGGSDDHMLIKMPSGMGTILSNADHKWSFETEPDPKTANRKLYWPRGKVLGGSSSINGMVYIRGNRLDYDQWRQLGLKGWGFADCLPYFKRSESNNTKSDPFHGNEGPLKVSDGSTGLHLFDAFVQAGVQAGYPHNPDFNGSTQEGVGHYQFTIQKGQRASTASTYLEQAKGRENLSIFTNSHAEKIVFEGTEATGVLISKDGEQLTLAASSEVICSAGAVGSPHLLLASGVGSAEHLREFGIPCILDLEGVGKNLQDHADYFVQYECIKPVTFHKYRSNRLLQIGVGLRYLLTKTGPAAAIPVEAGGFIKTRPELEIPDVQLQFVAALMKDHGRQPIEGGQRHGFLVHVTQLRPESRGRVCLKSPSTHDAPAIHPNYLDTHVDVQTMRDGVKLTRQIIAQPAMDPYRGDEIWPGASAQSDDEIDLHISKNVETDYHPVGTCKMGHDDKAVVDEQCRVRGIENLRIIDASVMPTIVSGNTNAPTIMIAEKMSDAILGRPFLQSEEPDNQG